MKLIKYFFFITIAISICSCSKKKKQITVNNFSEVIMDSLIPNKNVAYTNAFLYLNGYSSDTISIRFYGIEKKYIGKLNEKINTDYYGGITLDFEFNPINAKEGKLDIEFGMN